MVMNGWILLAYWFVVYFGLKFLDCRSWGQLDCDYFPPSLVAIVDLVMFWTMVELGVPILGAIPLSSLITMSLCKLTSSKFIKSIWLSSLHLTVWIYVVVVLFYAIGFLAILGAGIGGGLSERDDLYYY